MLKTRREMSPNIRRAGETNRNVFLVAEVIWQIKFEGDGVIKWKWRIPSQQRAQVRYSPGDHIVIPILNYVTWKKCSSMLCGYNGEKT